MLLGVSTALGISVEQLSNDYSETNYSSARAAIAETERSVRRRLAEFDSGFANPIYATWMDEAFDRRLFPLPRNAPDFLEARTAYARCKWRGPGAGLIDGLKERQASILGIDAKLTTRQDEIADESGRDYREILEQLANEEKLITKLGLTLVSQPVTAPTGAPAHPDPGSQ
jgi:capsid protein